MHAMEQELGALTATWAGAHDAGGAPALERVRARPGRQLGDRGIDLLGHEPVPRGIVVEELGGCPRVHGRLPQVVGRASA